MGEPRKCPQTGESVGKKWCVYTVGSDSAIKKNEEDFLRLAVRNSMGGPRGHGARLNKSDRQRQLPDDFTHMCNLKSIVVINKQAG